MLNLAFIRPESDSVEVGLSGWAGLVLTSAGGKSTVATHDLRGTQVTSAAVAQAMTAQHATLFFLHGHADRLGDPTVCADSTNIGQARGTVLVAFACLAGDRLGRDAVANGVRAFLGFDDILTNYLPQPALFGQHVDAALQPFILRNQSIDTVRAALVSAFQQIEAHYRTGAGQGHVNAGHIWMSAHINWRGLVLHGDPHATVP
jgi:hypothetical protein